MPSTLLDENEKLRVSPLGVWGQTQICTQKWLPGWFSLWSLWLQAMRLKLGVCLGVCGGWGRKDRQEGWGPGLTCAGLSLQEQFMFWDLGSGQGTVPASCRVAGCGELRLQQVFWGMRHEVRSSQGWGNATSCWFIYIYYVPDQLLKHQSKVKSFRGKSLSGCLLHRWGNRSRDIADARSHMY